MKNIGIDNKPFEVVLGHRVFEKDDILEVPKQPEMFNLTKWNWINKILTFLGFNVSFDMLVMSEPERNADCYSYQVKLENKWYCWFSYRLFKTKV